METVVIISCRFEWQATLPLFPEVELRPSPFGEWFTANLPVDRRETAVIFFQNVGPGS